MSLKVVGSQAKGTLGPVT